MKVSPFERAKLMAERDAVATGRKMDVLNLNPVGSPMYVVREHVPGSTSYMVVYTTEDRS